MKRDKPEKPVTLFCFLLILYFLAVFYDKHAVNGDVHILELRSEGPFDLDGVIGVGVNNYYVLRSDIGACVCVDIGLLLKAPAPYALVGLTNYIIVATTVAVGVVEVSLDVGGVVF